MISFSLFKRSPLWGVGVAVLMAGCNGQFPGSQKSVAAPKVASSSRPAPAPKPKPKPVPKPDPVKKFVDAHRIPVWAHGKVYNDVPVQPGDKPFALTFDDGPWPKYTDQILAILAEHNAKATFYMVGQMAQTHPEIVLRVRDAGHAIGNHSWSHPQRPKDPAAQVQRTNAQIKKITGFTPTTFRPPYGLLKNGMAQQAMKDRQVVFIWSADSNDWKRPSPDRITRTILNQATPGGVALFHDGGGDRSNTVAALPRILTELKARGYRFVTIPELLNARHFPAPTPPQTPAPPATPKKN